ncbi:unnamed protein product [Phytomonas sp. Hart1]|nr:unnamed protein product [Phytomonas sp. Hart1]|eukprot:CCW68662.1 unnamed protein product [Phytomonas sp. isolate Hart1]
MTVASSRPVDISVHDTASKRIVNFRCDLDLLLCNMKYFDTIIRKQLELEATNQCHKNETKDNLTGFIVPANSSCVSSSIEPVSIKVNCDINVFSWLFDWMVASKKPELKPSIVVSILLSSNFLLMNDLVDVALHYLCNHFVEVILSDVDMNCLTGELVGRLCSTITDADLARWYLRLHQFVNGNHPNRSFMTSMLWHWVIDRVDYTVFPTMSPPEDDCSAPSLKKTTPRRPKSRDTLSNKGASRRSTRLSMLSKKGSCSQEQSRVGGVVESEIDTSYNEFKGKKNGGLRWCCLCGILYDNQEYRRIVRSTALTTTKGASPNDGRTPSSSLSSSLKEPLCTGLVTPRGWPCMSPRGTILTTHTPSRLLVSLEPPSPQLASRAVELWAWQVMGVMRFVSCSSCKRILPLIEVVSHNCTSAGKGVEFGPAESIAPGTPAALDVHSLIDWYGYIARAGVYREEGNLVPIRCPLNMSGLLKAERIFLSNSTAKQQRTFFLKSARPSSSSAVRTYSWDTHPAAVDEVVMSEVDTPDQEENTRIIDVDVQNHYERQFMNALTTRLLEMKARSLSLAAKPQMMRDGSNPNTTFSTSPSNLVDGNLVLSEPASSKLLQTNSKSRHSSNSQSRKTSAKSGLLNVYYNTPTLRNTRFRSNCWKKTKMMGETARLPQVTPRFEK